MLCTENGHPAAGPATLHTSRFSHQMHGTHRLKRVGTMLYNYAAEWLQVEVCSMICFNFAATHNRRPMGHLVCNKRSISVLWPALFASQLSCQCQWSRTLPTPAYLQLHQYHCATTLQLHQPAALVIPNQAASQPHCSRPHALYGQQCSTTDATTQAWQPTTPYACIPFTKPFAYIFIGPEHPNPLSPPT
eukprot:GHRR01007073.1.p1 GENE.GHRR01007073.1~~GHRR01007073.1.p1  ORF type:complete len:190 (-),score=33.36 GHRR01007073.1:190-759(-)